MGSDLNRVIEVFNMVIKPIPISHPDRANSLKSLLFWFSERYEQSGIMDYLHSSTEALNMAIEAIAPNHPKRA